MRKVYQKTASSSAVGSDNSSWRRVVGVIEKLRSDDTADRIRERRQHETDEIFAVPRRMVSGDYLWDPDTMPDPEWLLHFYLPNVKMAYDANAKMFGDILDSTSTTCVRNAWCDALEFTHGKKSIERYVQSLDAVVMRAHKFYWKRMCSAVEDALASARRQK